MKLIYVIDENYKDELLSQNFKFINKTQIDGKIVWIMKPKLNFDFSKLDNKKCFCNNKIFL
jgi:hypothetical protein